METGFIKGISSNLPRVDSLVAVNFSATKNCVQRNLRTCKDLCSQSSKGLVFISLLISTIVVLILVNEIPIILEPTETPPTVAILNVGERSHRVSSKFLSFALDPSLIYSGWIHDNINSEKLLQLASHLAPAYLRIGGTLSDCLIFAADAAGKDATERLAYDGSGDCGSFCLPVVKNFSMTGYEWLQINKFCQNAGLELMFDLNVLLRNGKTWDSTNAKELFNFSENHNLSVLWQLGNEPNSFRHIFNVSITAKQLAKDFLSLRELLDSYARLKASMLVGPDVTSPKLNSYPSLEFLREFLDSGDNAINAVTWHHYYFNGRLATLEDFTNTTVFNSLAEKIKAVKATVRKKNKDLPLWLSETSTAYGGGAPGLSDVFVASFLWLDKLGVSARLGVDVVVRQDLYGGSYSLLDHQTLAPNPDWWLSVLYKALVSGRVLGAPVPTGSVRLYCHCAPPHLPASPGGAVTVFGMNLGPGQVRVQLGGVLGLLPPAGPVFSYVLTGESGLRSKTVLLNNKRLQLEPDGSLPPFVPVVVPVTHVYMPPLSMAFFVIYDTHVPGCRDK